MIKEGVGHKDDILPKYRDLYRNQIKKLISEELFPRVNYRRPDETNPAAAAPTRTVYDAHMPGMTQPDESDYIGVVDWPEKDRQDIIAKFNFPTRPSSFRVRLAQEDYWVYQALLDIIESTNGDAKSPGTAAVKAIELLQIGQDAAASIQSDKGPDLLSFGTGTGNVAGVVTPVTPQPQSGAPIMPSASKGIYNMPANTSTTGTSSELTPEQQELLKDRYVNEDLIPRPAGEHPYSEFKMMPILMRLKIDQRRISDLLVECANSSLPVEVKQFRMNPGTAAQTASTQPGHGGPAHAPMAVGANTQTISDKDPQVVTIEIRGIIYLYNPPDKSAVATGTVADEVTGAVEETPAEETTPVAEETPEPAEPTVEEPAVTPPATEPTTPVPPTDEPAGDL
jgi:hypothetical protein